MAGAPPNRPRQRKMSERPRLVRSCWGAEISPCSRERSKEHVLSKSIFKEVSVDAVTYQGLATAGSRKIGNNALCLPILCKSHNGALSDLDTEAGRWFSGIARLVSKPPGSTGLEDDSGQATLTVEGPSLERWAAKTFLNLVLADIALSPEKPWPLSLTGSQIAKPVFLGNEFHGRQGLYALPLDTNLFDDADFRSGCRLSIISTDARVWKNATKRWTTWRRFPLFLYISSHGFELLMHANLTSLNHDDWDKIAQGCWEHPKIRTAVAKPFGMRFDIPHLDGPRGPRPRRVIRFNWER